MFMVKEEYANIKNLLRLRFLTQAENYIWVFIIVGIIFLGGISPTIFAILQDNESIRYYNFADFSVMIFFALAFGYVNKIFVYRSTNDKLSVYPQTNNSRFISSLLFNFIDVGVLGLTVLAMYLIQYAIVRLLSVFVDNVHLALNFNLGFIIAGLFVYFIYSLLIVSIIELIGVILRKWTYFAVVVFAALLSFMIANIEAFIEIIPNVLAFLIREPSLALFFLKAIALLIVIIAISIAINSRTVYYKNKGLGLKKSTVIVFVVITIAVMLIMSFVLSFVLFRTNSAEMHIATVSEFFTEAEEIHIDISHLPSGSAIEVLFQDRPVMIKTGVGGTTRFFNETSLHLSGMEVLRNIEGNTLTILYNPPFFHVNGQKLFEFANPQMLIRLEGNVLFIDYSFDNAQVVILPIWGMARQFDFFQDRGLFTANAMGFSAGGSMTANLHFPQR